MSRPKPIVQKFGRLICISRTGEPTTAEEIRMGLENARTDHLPSRAKSPLRLVSDRLDGAPRADWATRPDLYQSLAVENELARSIRVARWHGRIGMAGVILSVFAVIYFTVQIGRML